MFNYNNIPNQAAIFKKWERLINAKNDIKDESIKMSTAVVLENAQNMVDRQHNINFGRGLLTEDTIGAGYGAGSFGDQTNGYDAANGDARVPSVVIPMIRRIYPQLIAHKLVGVQPMSGPIGMAFAFRAKYSRFGTNTTDKTAPKDEIGYLNVDQAWTGTSAELSVKPKTVNPMYDTTAPVDAEELISAFVGGTVKSDGEDTGTAENWAVGSTMPEAGFEFLKATVTAKTRKLGVQITRETEEDMKAMQGMNAQNEVSDIISYEIAQEIDRQLLGEIVASAVNAGNATKWVPANASGISQTDRLNSLYTSILARSNRIAQLSRRGAANWAVCSPTAAALLESQIYNPLSVGGGLGNANAYGKEMDEGIGVTEIGALRNGTIKLYRDTLARTDYILLGFKGNNVYDAGVIYLPYIPLELMHAVDPFTMNPVTAARTRYGVTTNLFGAGMFYQYIYFDQLIGSIVNAENIDYFVQ